MFCGGGRCVLVEVEVEVEDVFCLLLNDNARDK